MATWYRNSNRNKSAKQPALASTEKKSAAPARLQPSWTQLRFRMEMADELHIGWTECIGTYEFEEELEVNAAAPVQATVEFKRPSLAPIGGTIIDAQFIAINRTVQISAPPPPAQAQNDIPNRYLQQLSVSSQWRLNAALA